MTCKFSRLLLTKTFLALGRTATISGIIYIYLLVGLALAQSPSDASTAPAGGKKTAYVRFWNMLPAKPANNLQLLAGDKDSLMGVAPGDVFSDYIEVPSGNFTFVVRRLGEGSPAILRAPTALPEGGCLTLVATEKNGQANVEVINDTPDPKTPETTGRIVLRQFFPGAQVTAAVGNLPMSQSLSYGETAVIDNIPNTSQVVIKLKALLPTTPPTTRDISLTGNFSVLHHATLLLVADSYGRFRPRLAMDGRPPSKTP